MTTGVLGALSARSFLAMLEAHSASGTLFFSQGQASTLLLLRRGKLVSHTDVGTPSGDTAFEGGAFEGVPFDMDVSGARFGFWPHPESHVLPTLPSRYPEGSVLRALPALTETPLFGTDETDLRRLVSRLVSDSFSGALVLEGAAQKAVQGLLVFQTGRLGGAVCREGTRQRSAEAALRTLLHLGEPATLTLHALPEPITASLLGWLLGLTVDDTDGVPDSFSGLELAPDGVRYYRAGTPYLHLPQPQGAPHSHLFALCRHVPNLVLPSDPPGWEGRRYGLTLRGRDALNPMTELSMRFRSEFGRTGARALAQFRGDPTLEEAAATLSLELNELKGTVEQLEAEGFIRRMNETSPTVQVYTR
jgi:hypothetical protein